MPKIEVTKEDLAILNKTAQTLNSAKEAVDIGDKQKELFNTCNKDLDILQTRLHNQLNKAFQSRIESDSMGEIKVPADRYWAAQTQRSLHHFSIGKDLMPIEVIHALALIKKCAAVINSLHKKKMEMSKCSQKIRLTRL